MSDKINEDGTPKILFLEDALNQTLGASQARVICPITDPFVERQGALESFVRVYLNHAELLDGVLHYISSFPQVEVAMYKLHNATS